MFLDAAAIAENAETYSAYLQALIEHSPIAIIVLDSQHRFQMCNPAFEELFQYSREELTGNNVDELITDHNFLREATRITRRVLHSRKVHAITRRLRKDGEIVEVELYGVPLIVNGAMQGVYGLYQDITARNRAESAVRQLSSRLMNLQDEERRRIARDLHDTTSQELAVLNINLQRLDRVLSTQDSGIRQLLSETLQLAAECSQKIRSASYLLHPPLLQEAGLKPALLWFVEGFAERSGIRVNVNITPDLRRLGEEVELALFRVVQESLANVLRHSGSPDADVDVCRTARVIRVTIGDRGRGCGLRRSESVESSVAFGVGILGMRERIKQLGGSLNVRFTDHGTTVSAVLPATSIETRGNAKTKHFGC